MSSHPSATASQTSAEGASTLYTHPVDSIRESSNRFHPLGMGQPSTPRSTHSSPATSHAPQSDAQPQYSQHSSPLTSYAPQSDPPLQHSSPLTSHTPKSEPRSDVLQERLKKFMPEELGGAVFFKADLLENLSALQIDTALVEECFEEMQARGLRLRDPPPGSSAASSKSGTPTTTRAPTPRPSSSTSQTSPPTTTGTTNPSSYLEIPCPPEPEESAPENKSVKTDMDVVPPKSSADIQSWRALLGERQYYSIFKDLLNMITDIVLLKMAASSNVIAKSVIVYDIQMNDGIGGSRPLKPDLLVPLPDSNRNDKKRHAKNAPSLAWIQVEIPIEGKGRLGEMVKQAATYARATISANLDRRFVVVLLLGTGAKATVRVLIYSRAGICMASPIINFLRKDGMLDLIKAWARILSLHNWRDETVSTDGVLVAAQWEYKWKGSLINRLVCVRGRGTWVHLIEFSSTSTSTSEPSTKKREYSKIDEKNDPQASKSSDLKGFDGEPPSFLVVRDSWPLQGAPNDWTIWEGLTEYFGVPKVWGLESLGDTSAFHPKSSQPWDVFGVKKVHHEIRSHVRLYYQSIGTSLLKGYERMDMVDIFKALRQCFLAIVLLFRKGFLHRDVSAGNIVMLDTPEPRKISEEFQSRFGEFLNEEGCLAVLIDSDHAANLLPSQDCPAKHGQVTGTYEFMSTRLADAFLVNQSTIHTVLDDLESLTWVLVYMLWKKSPPLPGGKTSPFSNLWQPGEDNDFRALKYAKAEFTMTAAVNGFEAVPREYKGFFEDGLKPLFRILKAARSELKEIIESMDIFEAASSRDIFDLSNQTIDDYAAVWFNLEVLDAFSKVPTKLKQPSAQA